MNKTCVYTGPTQKPDAAPDGAKPVLFGRGYKDFAPTELVAASETAQPQRVYTFSHIDANGLLPDRQIRGRFN